MGELLRFDRDARLVRSVGDHPGVVVGLRSAAETGADSAVLLVDPGGNHKYDAFPAMWLLQHCEDAITHFALCSSIATSFMHESRMMLAATDYRLLGLRTAANERFQEEAAVWARTAFTLEELEAAAAELMPLFDGWDGPCGCPACQATVEFDALAGVEIPDDASALMSGPLAVKTDPPKPSAPPAMPRVPFTRPPDPARKPWWKR